MTLKLILIITLCAPDLGAMERAYTGVLNYSEVDRGTVSSDVSKAWAAPKMYGHRFILLRPASEANVFLRVVQSDEVAGYRPMTTFGWNATEIMVQDPDALAAKIREPGSGFVIAGEPRPLGPGSSIRAMQVLGPAHEVLYLTRLPEGAQPMGAARSFVDRPFIVIMGSRDLAASRLFLRDRLGLQSGEPTQARMTVLNKSFGLDVETTHTLAMARLSADYAIELDQYPPVAQPRPQEDGALPPAMAMVTFETNSLESVHDLLLAPPRRIKQIPYGGRRVATMRGSAGELIELVEDEP